MKCECLKTLVDFSYKFFFRYEPENYDDYYDGNEFHEMEARADPAEALKSSNYLIIIKKKQLPIKLIIYKKR